MPIEEVFTQVHHFKWDSTCISRIKKVANTNMKYAYSKEYKIMYDAIKATGDKIDIKNSEYLVEKLKESSYIDYMDYKHWNSLINKIVTI